MKKLLLLFFVITINHLAAFSLLPHGFFEISNGYRSDHLSTKSEALDINTVKIFTNDIKIKQIDMYQLGYKGQLSFCNFFCRSDGDLAWGNGGRYHEQFEYKNGRILDIISHSLKNSAKDLNIGSGYLFKIIPCIHVGPVVGYAFNQQSIVLKKAFLNEIEDAVFNDLKYKTTWHGPWLGVDAEFKFCSVNIYAGYEYHWADWNAAYRLKNNDLTRGFVSDRRKAKHAVGHILHLDGKWNFYKCWTAGIGVKYQAWEATAGVKEPEEGDVVIVGLGTAANNPIKKANWFTIACTFDIGAQF